MLGLVPAPAPSALCWYIGCSLCSTGTSVPDCFQCYCTSSSDPVQSCPADPDIRWVLSFCSNYIYISILPTASSGTVQNGTLLTPSEKHKLLLSTNSAAIDLVLASFQTLRSHDDDPHQWIVSMFLVWVWPRPSNSLPATHWKGSEDDKSNGPFQ